MLQERIRRGTISLLKVATVIDKLPPGSLRSEMEAKHEVILTKLAELHGELPVDGGCWFGLVEKCTQPNCPECPEYDTKIRQEALK